LTESKNSACGEETLKKGGNLVAWETIQKPIEKGGLGVINLRLQNDALLLKHLHKFYNRESLPWVDLVWFKYYQNKVPHTTRELGSFWWKDNLRLNGIYRGFSQCVIGDGVSACFWKDRWSASVFATSFPRLASFALNSVASVKEVLEAEDLDAIFFSSLSQEAFQELEQLQETLPHLELEANSRDKWKPVWGNEYSVKKFYYLIYDLIQAHPIFKSVWKSRCTPRVKFFILLILVDRLNTKTMISRRHIGKEPMLIVFCAI
jgi:hypothetical protein